MTAYVHGVPGRRRAGGRIVVIGAVALVGVLGLQRLSELLPDLGNPFGSTAVDRSEPAVLRALEDASRFHAATANYSVVVDVEDDVRYVPAFLAGERAVFVAVGSVPVTVDLAALGAGNVTVDGDDVLVRLPEPVVGDAAIDADRSRVASRDRGVLDRLGSVFSDTPTGDRRLYLAAERQLEAAAAADDSLAERARVNTKAMLGDLLEPLGFDVVGVEFVDA